MQHAHDAEAASSDVAQGVSPAAAQAVAGLLTADVLWLQRSAGNAAVGRLLQHQLPPSRRARGRDRRMLQRQQVAALTPPTFAACGWIDAAEVTSFLAERDSTRRRSRSS